MIREEEREKNILKGFLRAVKGEVKEIRKGET